MEWYKDALQLEALQNDLTRRQVMRTLNPPQSLGEAVYQAQAQGWRLEAMTDQWAVLHGATVTSSDTAFWVVNLLLCFTVIWIPVFIALLIAGAGKPTTNTSQLLIGINAEGGVYYEHRINGRVVK